MSSSKRAFSSTPASTNVNLYCAQCEAQIGIFDNEWIRLTSSYARSKDKGTHFGTEVGQRTQVVPGGPLPRTAEGCEMAEVFCRKCSNMVGQYCKKAPDASKESLVDQYFYKLSRTFLKNSKTNVRVEPVFGYSPDVAGSTPGARLSIGPRTSMTPSSRWMNTPLREASRTPSVQTATRSALRNQSSTSLPYEKPLPLPLYGSPEQVEPSQQAMDILKQELAAQNSTLREHSTRLKNQAGQVSDHEGCLRDHDARIEDQENCIRAQASRILEQDDTIGDQRRMIEKHEEQLSILGQQLSHLRHLVDNLNTTPTQEVRSSNLAQKHTETGHIDFVGSFESLVRAMKEAQTTTHEAQLLREQNQDLRNRLNSVLGTVSDVADNDARGNESLQPGPRDVQVLGKRKRGTPNSRNPSLRPTESPTTNERRLVRFNEQSLSQLPTPQSLQNHVSPTQNPGARSSTQLLEEHGERLVDTQTQQDMGVKSSGDSFARSNRGVEELLDSADTFPDKAINDTVNSTFLPTTGASVRRTQGHHTMILTHDVTTQPALLQTAYTLPDPVTGVNAGSTAQENSELPSRMTTRSSAGAVGHRERTSQQDLARSSSHVQCDVDSSAPAQVPHVSRQRRSSATEADQSRLPSVQIAGRVPGTNLQPLQDMPQAFAVQPNSRQPAASTSVPQPSSADLPTASSSTVQPSFDGQNTPLPTLGSTSLLTKDQSYNQPAAARAATQHTTPPGTVFVQDNSMYDNNVDFSDDENDTGGPEIPDGCTDRDSNRRVTDTWIDRDTRSMAPEPTKRRKTVSHTGPKYVTLDRVRIATPQMWTDAISKGIEPKLSKPPSINRRQLDLHAELRMLGLAEWIPRNKKSKEYREVVAAARSKYRDARLAEVLQEKGLSHRRASSPNEPEQTLESSGLVSNDQVLSPLDNVRAIQAPLNDSTPGNENSQVSQPAQDKRNDVEVRDDQDDHEAPRLTRARARRSSASLDARLDDPEEAIRGVTAGAERPSKKRRSDGRSTSQRKPDMQPSVTIAPDASHSAAVAQESLSSANENFSEVAAQSGVQQSYPVTKKGRGRPKKSQGPVAAVTNNVRLVQEHETPMDGHGDSVTHSSASLSTSNGFPPERQKLLESMKSRAQQREEAIAARDLMAKQAIEAMEREDL